MSVRAKARETVGRAMRLLGRPPGRGRVLLYHRIAVLSDPAAAVAPDLFRRQLLWLAAHDLALASISALMRSGWPAGAVALSFDDGHPSALAAAADIAGQDSSATVFVVPDWIERGAAEVCTWADLRSLAGMGVEIASHDLAHERPCGVPAEALTERYRASRVMIEDRVGHAVAGLAYPYGLAPARARRAAELAGYTYAVTSEPGPNGERTDPFRLRRNEVSGTDASARSFLGKLGGTDDWFRPFRMLENGLACR